MGKHLFLSFLCLFLFGELAKAEEGKHLFIFSGQSNMARLDPSVSFTPAVEKEFGKANVLVVKDAHSGQPIRRWVKSWKPAEGRGVADPSKLGDLYERLMGKVASAIEDQKIASVTFIWMQGESDTGGPNGEVYAKSLEGLLEQIQRDLKRDDLNFVIGRLSDMDMENRRYKNWTTVRDAQVKVANDSARGAWVDTDDLPMKEDKLHYDAEGYRLLGTRFAEKAIELLKKDP